MINQLMEKSMGMGKNNISYYYGFVLFTLFFIIFPFGQLLRIERYIADIYIVIHPVDVISFLSLPYLFLVRKNYLFKYIGNIIFILISSLIFSLIIFKPLQIISGSLYLLRIISYYSFSLLVYRLSIGTKIKNLLLTIMLFSIIVFMLLGMYQYLYFYDLRDLYFVGWDEHYYRLSSTLLDPGYSAVVFIIGLIIILKSKIIKIIYFKYILVFMFLMSLLLTFSRAGYLTFLFLMIFLYRKYYKLFILVMSLLLLILIMIPKPHSSGVELYRTFSIYSRLDNYKNTFLIFLKTPLFGVGYNNICRYRTDYLNIENRLSHSCSGSDSSIMLMLSTTGVVGIMVFVNSLYKINQSFNRGEFDKLLIITFLTILLNSFFNNSFFYNFIMGLLAVFIGLTRNNAIPDNR